MKGDKGGSRGLYTGMFCVADRECGNPQSLNFDTQLLHTFPAAKSLAEDRKFNCPNSYGSCSVADWSGQGRKPFAQISQSTAENGFDTLKIHIQKVLPPKALSRMEVRRSLCRALARLHIEPKAKKLPVFRNYSRRPSEGSVHSLDLANIEIFRILGRRVHKTDLRREV